MTYVPPDNGVVPWLRALFGVAALGCVALVATAFVTGRFPAPDVLMTVVGYAGLFSAFAARPEILSDAFVPRTASERGLRALFRVSFALIAGSLWWAVVVG